MPDRQATAMLDCEDGETEANSNCKHCQASGDQQRYWDIQLDQDLLETICGIYPEWFKECNMNLGSENNNNNTAVDIKIKQEETSQKAIDKNKESLKVKLMLRRPFNQLVDQGIIPSLKSSPSFHESRQKLERAKMGDILKHKIQKRPDRQELIQQHILEDSCADNSLPDQQRQQKRARLSESGLSERLSQRTSGLELVKVNILHADEILAQAVREGGLQFHGSCDTPSPQFRLGPDDDSGSDGTFSPSPPYDEHSQGSLPSLDANESSPLHPNQGSPCSGGAFSMSPPSSASSPLSSILPAVVSPQSDGQIFDHYMVHIGQHKDHHAVAPNNNKNRKKTKPKTQPKARTIKFHEYKVRQKKKRIIEAMTSMATQVQLNRF